jgi:hypothetical protein
MGTAGVALLSGKWLGSGSSGAAAASSAGLLGEREAAAAAVTAGSAAGHSGAKLVTALCAYHAPWRYIIGTISTNST